MKKMKKKPVGGVRGDSTGGAAHEAPIGSYVFVPISVDPDLRPWRESDTRRRTEAARLAPKAPVSSDFFRHVKRSRNAMLSYIREQTVRVVVD